ncbi:hypothetical protein JCM19294_2073 [Nonlabens tegetincola]|uniref:Uncharacterized protein n=1 Tax=Nonlabens tegetincola TaxID=323273 RepID=A0A090Q0M7_9FLAO|nr:hypothetical protein JCM19294_2073 [Nonlabens tegetincola]
MVKATDAIATSAIAEIIKILRIVYCLIEFGTKLGALFYL